MLIISNETNDTVTFNKTMKEPALRQGAGLKKMPKISFSADKTIGECNSELVSKLLQASSVDTVNTLEEEYGQNEVVDAIFAIADEYGSYDRRLNEDTITDWLWNEYYDNCHEYIIDAFIEERL